LHKVHGILRQYEGEEGGCGGQKEFACDKWRDKQANRHVADKKTDPNV
jgi:hypothetical protein